MKADIVKSQSCPDKFDLVVDGVLYLRGQDKETLEQIRTSVFGYLGRPPTSDGGKGGRHHDTQILENSDPET